ARPIIPASGMMASPAQMNNAVGLCQAGIYSSRKATGIKTSSQSTDGFNVFSIFRVRFFESAERCCGFQDSAPAQQLAPLPRLVSKGVQIIILGEEYVKPTSGSSADCKSALPQEVPCYLGAAKFWNSGICLSGPKRGSLLASTTRSRA